jgi:hypothetical protein
MMMKIIGNAYISGEEITLYTTYYPTGHTAVVSTDSEGCPYANLSIDIPEAELSDDEFIFDKNNAGRLVSQLIETGFFKPTGRDLHSGYCTYPVWQIL